MQQLGRAGAAALALAVLGAASAKAQGWQEYAFSDAGFSAQFPVRPTVAELGYRIGGETAAARAYAAHQGALDFSVTVVDLTPTGIAAHAAMDDAIKGLAATGRVKLDVSERIDRQFGRELSIGGRDGSQTAAAIFVVDGRLYILAGTASAPDAAAASALILRFQQSLQFIDKTGRPPRRPEDGPGGFGPPGGPPGQDGGRESDRRRPPPQAFADCRGKAEGDAVQHRTPRGDVVAATCIGTPQGLAARPDTPPGGAPPEG
jgi:hypothetical protein